MRLNASASSLLSMNSAKWTCRITAAKAALRNLKAKITSSLGRHTGWCMSAEWGKEKWR
jgi:hypothetical protein